MSMSSSFSKTSAASSALVKKTHRGPSELEKPPSSLVKVAVAAAAFDACESGLPSSESSSSSAVRFCASHAAKKTSGS